MVSELFYLFIFLLRASKISMYEGRPHGMWEWGLALSKRLGNKESVSISKPHQSQGARLADYRDV